MRALLPPLALVALAAATGCSGPPPSTSYFPLEAGHRWQYRQVSDFENATREEEQVVITTLGQDDSGSGRAWHRRSDSGMDYWLRADDSGIYRVAAKSDNQPEPVKDDKPRYVLKMPLATGTQWQAMTTAYLLRRRNEFPPEIRHSHAPVLMTYTLEAKGEAVETRAGRFTDCLRVVGRAAMKVFADPVIGFKDMPLTTTEWYCAGAGLVKLTREEPAQSTFLVGGTLTMELEQWQ